MYLAFESQKQQLRDAETKPSKDIGRHATWLELFFDLVVAVAVTGLAGNLARQPTLAGVGAYMLLFVPVWWTWMGFSYLASQFDQGTRRMQFILLVAMFGALVLAGDVSSGLYGHVTALPITYVGLRMLLIASYLWHACTDSEAQPLCLRYAAGFSAGAAVWLASLAVPGAIRWMVWIGALAVEIVTPVIAHLRTVAVPTHTSHMPERFGLFTLIVLGEAVLAVATGSARTHGSTRPLVIAIAGFVLAGALWWAYFRHADETVISKALTGGRRELLLSYVYGYSHLIVFASIAATGVGVTLSIQAASGLRPDRPAAVLVSTGVAAFLVSSSVAHWARPRSLSVQAIAARVLASALLVLGTLLGPMVAPWLTIAFSAAAVLAAQIFSVDQDATIGHAGRSTEFTPDSSADIRPTGGCIDRKRVIPALKGARCRPEVDKT